MMAQQHSPRFRWARGLILSGLALGLWACQPDAPQPQGQGSPTPTSSPSVTPTSPASPTPNSPAVTPSPTTSPTPAPVPPTDKPQAAIYWMATDPGKVEFAAPAVMPTTAPPTAPEDQLTEALEKLLQGPADPQKFATLIPVGTTLNTVRIKSDGVHVDLSSEFAADNGSGTTGLSWRLGQLLYTASSLNPDDPVWISVEGEPLELLSEGHGLEVLQPMTRKDFQTDYLL